ncbi:hypothetical protein ANN_12774 [Periplaneta americana]|uniref:Uncharacterized protein n=1 Tax=Periplaneta americana TaxID=6978 RepID=A0ABQ8TI22_PERAM|nr:hypothetical protein ANN_12774 [Periplaneta americana]
MAGLCESGNEPSGSLKASLDNDIDVCVILCMTRLTPQLSPRTLPWLYRPLIAVRPWIVFQFNTGGL